MLCSFLRYLYICPVLFGFAGKRLDKKVKANFKIYDKQHCQISEKIKAIR